MKPYLFQSQESIQKVKQDAYVRYFDIHVCIGM